MRLSAETANLEFDTFVRPIQLGVPFPLEFNDDINWRTVLGDMYDKYDYFYIVYNSFGGFSGNMTYSAGSITGITAAGLWSMTITGDLQFVSNSFNGQLTNVGIFPDLTTLPANGYYFLNSTINNGIIFRKPLNSTSRVVITPYFMLNNEPALAIAVGGATQIDFNMSFTIYGLEEA